MKQLELSVSKLTLLSLIIAMMSVSCENSTDPEHGHMQEVTFTYSPTPATTGTEITLLFVVEEGGVHTSVMDAACEIHDLSTVTLAAGETGHYSGTHTFAQAGTFDIHFSFTHEGSMVEEAFTITVN